MPSLMDSVAVSVPFFDMLTCHFGSPGRSGISSSSAHAAPLPPPNPTGRPSKRAARLRELHPPVAEWKYARCCRALHVELFIDSTTCNVNHGVSKHPHQYQGHCTSKPSPLAPLVAAHLAIYDAPRPIRCDLDSWTPQCQLNGALAV